MMLALQRLPARVRAPVSAFTKSTHIHTHSFHSNSLRAEVAVVGTTQSRLKSTEACPSTTPTTPTTTTPTTPTTSTPTPTTTLKEVPILPYIGSMIPQYSKTPKFDPNNTLEFWIEMRSRYGNFYKMGIPGFGKGRDGILYLLNDPSEMMKIIRQEKNQEPYPRGIIEAEWPMIRMLQEQKSTCMEQHDISSVHDVNGFFGRGESWKKFRTFLQTDLLSPQASKRFIPGMVQSAKIASQAAPHSVDDLNAYTNRCAFDMFSSLMFGELTKTADLSSAQQENVDFCNNTVEGMSKMIHQMIQPTENILGNILGMKTSTYGEMSSAWEKVFETSGSKYMKFRSRLENDYDNLDQLEKDSYLAQAIERQKEDESGFITEDHLLEIVKIMLSAAVDTTSSPFGWNLYHIAVNQDVQMKLYDELSSAIESEGGEINEQFLKPSTCPYLHAVIRESHRLTPAAPITLSKENSLADVQIHDTVIPKGSLVSFDNYSLGMDPNIIDNPTHFQPERWLPPAIEARKGTPAETIDHPFFKAPFSHGSRKCPGSRVANNEILILISQLVLDWKISAPSNINSYDDMEYTMTGMVTPNLPKLEFQARM